MTVICDTMEASRRGAGNATDGSDPQIAYTIGGLRVSVPRHTSPLSAKDRSAQCFPLRFFRAQKIAYPAGVCVYCGLPGFTKDHLLPVTMTGEALRKFVAVVPACGECNFAIGDRVGHRITERRAEAHRHIERKYRKTLALGKRWTPAELNELGPKLRAHIEKSLQQREVQLARLAWPDDPEYDKRAFQKSGFDDPIGMELL